MKSVEEKKMTKCTVADIFHWDFNGGEGWDACLLLAVKQLGDVGILDSALEEGRFEQLHPSAILLLACVPAPSPSSAHCLWTISPTQMLHVQSQFLCGLLYSCPKSRPVCFSADLLSAPNSFDSSQFLCQALLNSQKKTVGKAYSSMSFSSLESLGKLLPPPSHTWTKVSIF